MKRMEWGDQCNPVEAEETDCIVIKLKDGTKIHINEKADNRVNINITSNVGPRALIIPLASNSFDIEQEHYK